MRLLTPTGIGHAIRERRRSLALDQETLAARVCVTRQWIIDVEKGKRRAELRLVLRTLSALGLILSADTVAPPSAVGAAAITADDLGRVLARHRGRRATLP